jgi:sulfur relay (sulfurtransferase) complex TusBCD TusD component (DsrE family)
MGKLLLILFSPPTQLQNTVTVCELSKAAVETGHEVTVFFDADATYNLVASHTVPSKTTAASRIADLIKRGVSVLVCRESARLRGIDTKKDLIKGVVESSLGGLADLMGKHDRIAAFGSSNG